ncbi:MAG: glycosyltransferase, partial [Spirochaetota bacterium]
LLVEFPELSPDRIDVIPPLSELSERRGADTDSAPVGIRGLESGRYLLLLSCDRPVKNAFRVLEALEHKRVPGAEDLAVACVGFRPYQVDAVRRWYPRTSARSVFIPYVGREELDALFAGAFAFLYPSISEGFGYPPLEAMRAGTPVVASPHTAISEVCADAVLYANPYSASEIAARLARLLAEPAVREELIRRGRLRSAEYEGARADKAARFLSFVRRIAGYAGG